MKNDLAARKSASPCPRINCAAFALFRDVSDRNLDRLIAVTLSFLDRRAIAVLHDALIDEKARRLRIARGRNHFDFDESALFAALSAADCAIAAYPIIGVMHAANENGEMDVAASMLAILVLLNARYEECIATRH